MILATAATVKMQRRNTLQLVGAATAGDLLGASLPSSLRFMLSRGLGTLGKDRQPAEIANPYFELP